MAANHWKQELEQKIQKNEEYSRNIHIFEDLIDAQELYNICKKLGGKYELHFHQPNVTNGEMIQKLIEEDYISKIYIYLPPESTNNILRFILEGTKPTKVLRSVQIDGFFSIEDNDIIDAALSQNNSIQDLQVAVPLYKTLKIHPSIAKLKISINTEDNVDNGEYIVRLFEGLEQNKTVTSFKFSDRSDPNCRRLLQLSDKICMAIGKCLSNNITIEELDIEAEIENKVGSEYVADGFAKNKSIRKLKLSMVINEDNTDIFKRVFTENKTITDLNLAHNGLFGLGELITSQSAIKILSTRHYDAKFLEYAISPSCKIEDLFLSLSVYHVGFNPDLDQLLAKNTSIKKFRLESDSKQHIDSFTKGLAENTSITDLNAFFEDNLPNSIVSHIYEYLKNSKSLVSFKLECSASRYLADSTLDLLLETFKTNTTLERLHIPNIRLTCDTKGINDVAAALKDNKSLTDVEWPDSTKLMDYIPENEAILSIGYRSSNNPIIKRNRELRLERIILIHNLTRNSNFIAMLPMELWRIIFSHLRFPGIKAEIIHQIFEALCSHVQM